MRLRQIERDGMLTVRVRVQMRVPTEGEREKCHVIEAGKL